MTTLYFKKCPRCSGPVEAGSEAHYHYLRCICCGWRVETPIKKEVTA